MVRNPDFVEISHHDEILADIATFQSSGEVVRHEPANHVTTERDGSTDDMIFDFVVT